jgi:hypothetical protein
MTLNRLILRRTALVLTVIAVVAGTSGCVQEEYARRARAQRQQMEAALASVGIDDVSGLNASRAASIPDDTGDIPEMAPWLVRYSTEAGATGTIKVMLARRSADEGFWQWRQVLASHQLFAAHPVAPRPDQALSIEQQIVAAAAREVEAELAGQQPPPEVVSESTSLVVTADGQLAEVMIAWLPDGAGEVLVRRALVRDQPNGWVFERSLSETERLDLETGEVVEVVPDGSTDG